MKRYIRAKTFYKFRQRFDVERTIKSLTFMSSSSSDNYKDSYRFEDENGIRYTYECPENSSLAKVLTEAHRGDKFKISAYFIESPVPTYSGIISNPRIVK